MAQPTLSRRSLLAALGAGATVLPTFMGARAHAADVSGYKALVCIFLFGGMDSHELLIPHDQPSHDIYTQFRQGIAPAGSRTRDALLVLNPSNSVEFGSRAFALPPEMTGIRSLFDQGRASLVANVGPLIRPVSRTAFENRTVSLPPRLFSHNDQQAVWQANAPEGARLGWGGLLADAALASGANGNAAAFSAISTSGDNLFLTGERAQAYSLGRNGPTQVSLYRRAANRRDRNDEAAALYERLRRHFAASDFNGNSLIGSDIADTMSTSLDNNEALQSALEALPTLGVTFPESRLGGQLQRIAETIAVRSSLGVGRQIFFAGTGGFDTHSGQAQTLPALLADLNASMTAFQGAMDYLGEDQNVTLFTASDFGRTFAVNGDGTDHGWGSHQIVMGGAVNGGRIVGNPPPPGFDHASDAGSGRLIPDFSVDQYAASLGRWFGLGDSELDAAFPNLGNFNGNVELF
ncbi:DUF1501 domain-containing protein [Maricaulaceae bacterium NA33B04]|nr:DUF1501 domain-containing protein [Maricaulaceae bacterium NA33B04]